MFDSIEKPNPDLFFKRNDPNDVRLGEIVPQVKFEEAQIVIIGYPQDEGVKRNRGREGSRNAPDKIREQFYELSNFGISHKICDLGNINIYNSLEETHDAFAKLAMEILQKGKRIIALGGGKDLSYANGRAMFENFGDNWVAINVDPHFDVEISEKPHNGTPYRQLLEENLLHPDYFYEIAYQTQLNSPIYYNYLQNLGVNLMSLDQLRSTDHPDEQLRELLRGKFIRQSSSLNVFFGFNVSVIRAPDAPGTSSPNPVGLREGEFLNLIKFAASLANTKIIEFTEVNPDFDIDNQTTKLIALAMHRFCASF